MFGNVKGLTAETKDGKLLVYWQLTDGRFVQLDEIEEFEDQLCATKIFIRLQEACVRYGLKPVAKRRSCHCGDDCKPGQCINTPA